MWFLVGAAMLVPAFRAARWQDVVFAAAGPDRRPHGARCDRLRGSRARPPHRGLHRVVRAAWSRLRHLCAAGVRHARRPRRQSGAGRGHDHGRGERHRARRVGLTARRPVRGHDRRAPPPRAGECTCPASGGPVAARPSPAARAAAAPERRHQRSRRSRRGFDRRSAGAPHTQDGQIRADGAARLRDRHRAGVRGDDPTGRRDRSGRHARRRPDALQRPRRPRRVAGPVPGERRPLLHGLRRPPRVRDTGVLQPPRAAGRRLRGLGAGRRSGTRGRAAVVCPRWPAGAGAGAAEQRGAERHHLGDPRELPGPRRAELGRPGPAPGLAPCLAAGLRRGRHRPRRSLRRPRPTLPALAAGAVRRRRRGQFDAHGAGRQADGDGARRAARRPRTLPSPAGGVRGRVAVPHRHAPQGGHDAHGAAPHPPRRHAPPGARRPGGRAAVLQRGSHPAGHRAQQPGPRPGHRRPAGLAVRRPAASTSGSVSRRTRPSCSSPGTTS